MIKMEKEIVVLSDEDKKVLFEILGYSVDSQGIIIDEKQEKVICPFTKTPVELKNSSLMPGSLIIMNTTPVTLSEYFYQYPDD